MKYWMYIANMLILLIGFLSMVYFAFIYLGPVSLPIVTDIKTDELYAIAGGTLDYSVFVNKKQPTEATVYRSIVCNSGIVENVTSFQDSAPVGTHILHQSMPVPDEKELGVCHIEFNVHYRINAFRTENRAYSSNDFTIIENNHE